MFCCNPKKERGPLGAPDFAPIPASENGKMRMPKRRFSVGDRVLICSATDGWLAAQVIRLNVCEPQVNTQRNWPRNHVVPYQVKLDNERNVYVPDDVQSMIRPFEEMAGRRFQIGDHVECNCGQDLWLAGTVTELDVLDPALNLKNRWPANMSVPYKVCLADGRSIFAPEDVDFVIRKVAPQQNNLTSTDGEEESEVSEQPQVQVKRFQIGERVEYRTDTPSHEWCAGLIKATDVCDDETNRYLGWPPGTVVPYEVELESGATVLVHQDSEDFVRAYKSPPTPSACDTDSESCSGSQQPPHAAGQHLENEEQEEESEEESKPEDEKEEPSDEPQEEQVFEILESKAPQIELPTEITHNEELSERRCAEPEPLPQEAEAAAAVAVRAEHERARRRSSSSSSSSTTSSGSNRVVVEKDDSEMLSSSVTVTEVVSKEKPALVQANDAGHSSSMTAKAELVQATDAGHSSSVAEVPPPAALVSSNSEGAQSAEVVEKEGKELLNSSVTETVAAASAGESQDSDSDGDSSDECYEQGQEGLESMDLLDQPVPVTASPTSTSSSLFGFMSFFGIKACCDTRPGGVSQGGTEKLVVVKPPEKSSNNDEESTEDMAQEEIKPSGKWLK